MIERDDQQCNKKNHYPFTGLGKWYSWDTPVGLSIGICLTLVSIGIFIFTLLRSGIFI